MRPNNTRFLDLCFICLTLFCVGYIDYHTGPQLSFLIAYIVIIAITAQRIGGFFCYVVAVIAATIRIITMAPLYDGQPFTFVWNYTNVLGVYSLISYLLNRNYTTIETLSQATIKDPLTSAFNTKGFVFLLDKAIAHTRRHKEPMSVAFMDVDRFKQVNDTRGHKAGDILLKQIVTTINSQLRAEDAVCRMGGDEFALLIARSDLSETYKFLGRMKSVLDKMASEEKYDISFSMGAVCYNGNADVTHAELLHQADESMYRVKRTTKNDILVEAMD